MITIKINPWFGQAPNKWQQGQLKRFYSVRLGKMLQPNPSNSNDQLIPYIRAANVSWAGPDISDIKEMWASPEEITNNKLEAGDLLISEGGDVGRSCLWSNEIPLCIFQNAINRIRPRDLNSTKFLYYAMQAVKGSGWIDIICNKATISHFTAEKVNALEIPIPNPTEQRRIATYLDEQTAKIDRLINLRQRQMALLKEQRAALIQQAVTRGLNPNVPMKDSGLPWLGEIPAHWDIKPLGSIASVKARLGWKGLKAEEYVDEGYIFLATPNLKGEEIDFDNVNYITKERYFESPEIMLREGDVLIVKDGATLGIISLVKYLPAPATVNGSSAVIRPHKDCDSAFVCYWLRSNSVQQLIDMMKGGMGVPHLFQSDIRRFPVALPPINEQNEIVLFIERETLKIDTLHAAYSRQLTLLAEYRAALIHESVTGQRVIPMLQEDRVPSLKEAAV